MIKQRRVTQKEYETFSAIFLDVLIAQQLINTFGREVAKKTIEGLLMNLSHGNLFPDGIPTLAKARYIVEKFSDLNGIKNLIKSGLSKDTVYGMALQGIINNLSGKVEAEKASKEQAIKRSPYKTW